MTTQGRETGPPLLFTAQRVMLSFNVGITVTEHPNLKPW